VLGAQLRKQHTAKRFKYTEIPGVCRASKHWFAFQMILASTLSKKKHGRLNFLWGKSWIKGWKKNCRH